jgi:hypothetical protein
MLQIKSKIVGGTDRVRSKIGNIIAWRISLLAFEDKLMVPHSEIMLQDSLGNRAVLFFSKLSPLQKIAAKMSVRIGSIRDFWQYCSLAGIQ